VKDPPVAAKEPVENQPVGGQQIGPKAGENADHNDGNVGQLSQCRIEGAILVIICIAMVVLLGIASWIAASNRVAGTTVTERIVAISPSKPPPEQEQVSNLLDLAIRADAANSRMQRQHATTLICVLVGSCMVVVGGLLATLVLSRLGTRQLDKLPVAIWAPLALSVIGAIVLCTAVIVEATGGAEGASRDILKMLR